MKEKNNQAAVGVNEAPASSAPSSNSKVSSSFGPAQCVRTMKASGPMLRASKIHYCLKFPCSGSGTA